MATAVIFSVLLLSVRFTARAPGLLAALETLLTLCATMSGWWLAAKFRRYRRLSNLLSVAALTAMAAQDLICFTVPAITGAYPGSAATRPSGAWLLIAMLFLAAALAPRNVVLHRADWRLAAAVSAGAVISILLVTLRPLARWQASARPGELALVAAGLLLLAGAGYISAALREHQVAIAGWLAAAAVLLAASWGYTILGPAVPWAVISGRTCLRVLAYGCILVVALQVRRELRRHDSVIAAAGERRRWAQDLHDGMAQDLAFIAMYGENLTDELGPDHPLILAARRALELSRGAIVDLTGRSYASTGDALRAVADELAARHQVVIRVDTDGGDLRPVAREEVVRIAREAMVNAVEHGRARTILVRLRTSAPHFSLSVLDDGQGVHTARETEVCDRGGRGHGLRTMSERAAAIGASLVVRKRPGGGTTVEVEA